MFSFFKRHPKKLSVEVYENGVLQTLCNYNDYQLSELRKVIVPLIRTPETSVVFFEVEAFDCKALFSRTPKVCMEVLCYKRDPNHWSGQRKHYIPTLYVDKFAGKKYLVKPDGGAFRKWADKVEVKFVL